MDLAQSLVAVGFVIAAILIGKLIADHAPPGSGPRHVALAAYWLGFVPLGATLACRGPAAFQGLSAELTILLKILAGLLVSAPLVIGGLLLVAWASWVLQHGFFMGASKPGDPKDMVLGFAGLVLIAAGILSLWFIFRM